MTRPAQQEVTIWNTATGEVLYSTRLVIGEYVAPGFDALPGVWDGSDWRIDPATGKPQPLPEIAPRIADNVISGLPDGAIVCAADATGEAVGGAIHLDPTGGVPQMVDIYIQAPLHKTWQGRIEISGARATGAPALQLAQPYHLMRGQPGIGYPDERDQFDAAWKILGALVDSATPAQRSNIPADAIAVLEQVRAVKRRFPKD